MLNFLLSPKSLTVAGLVLVAATAIHSGIQSNETITMASRYHLRQHAAVSAATGRSGFGTSRRHNDHQHLDHVRPTGPHNHLNPSQKIAIKPSSDVRS